MALGAFALCAKKLLKSTLGVNFKNMITQAFTYADPKSAKNAV